MPTHKHADTEIGRSFHLPRVVDARLRELSASSGVPVAELLRRAISAYLERIDAPTDCQPPRALAGQGPHDPPARPTRED